MSKYVTSVCDGATIRHPHDIEVADPFAEIDYQQLTVDGQQIPRFALSLVHPETKVKTFVQSHTDAYAPISNRAAMAVAGQVVDRMAVAFKPADMLWDGSRFSAQFVSERLVLEAVKGDVLALGLMVHNSYDRSTSFGLRFFIQRLACLNGMFFTEILGGFSFKHLDGSEEQIDEASHTLLGASERFPELVSQLGKLTSIPATMDSIARWSLNLDVGTPRFPRAHTLTVLSQVREKPKPTLWDQLNAFTSVASHEVQPFTGIDLSDRICRLALAEVGGRN